ncbi:unnamed protein product [Lymnaea stagnalis]|uniref:Uncharacterized protein n=1 Tax=Lymnaea stagnalis TaxID=6523 RepID=A0AAV2I936_LYMST
MAFNVKWNCKNAPLRVLSFLVAVVVVEVFIGLTATDYFKAVLVRGVQYSNKVKLKSRYQLSSTLVNQTQTRFGAWVWTTDDLVKDFNEMLAQDTDAPNDYFPYPCGNKAYACTQSCPQSLSPDPTQRLVDILVSPNLTLSQPQLDAILSMTKSIPESDIVILSATSSNHYDEMQAMFENLHSVVYPVTKYFSVVLFDIGLTPEQRRMTEEKCACHVITFPFELFPDHVKDAHCFSWKPLIVRATIEKARHLLVYQDASIRWTDYFQVFLRRIDRIGLQLTRSSTNNRIPVNTLPQMFAYMGEAPCAFSQFPELHASNAGYRRDALIIRAILEPWARCALEASCMCPVESSLVIDCVKLVAEHRCHRFDQSALGIIGAKLFGDEFYRVMLPDMDAYLDINRDQVMPDYFRSIR